MEKTILVVDDEPLIRRLLGRTLRRAGLAVVEAARGADAIAFHARHRGEIAAVVLDHDMPGMTGSEVLGKLLEVESGLPVLLISGGLSPVTAQELIARGAREFLAKPFSGAQIVDAVSRLLDARPP